MDFRIECIAESGCLLGEGPVWEAREGRLLWVDIKDPAVWSLDLASRRTQRRAMPDRLGAIGLREKGGGLVGAFKNGFAFIDLATGAVTPIGDPEAHLPENRFNDGKVDALGRFWASTMDDDERRGTGHLYRLDPDLSIARFEIGFVVTNGIDWSGDGRTLYFVDTFGRTIYGYGFDMPGGRLGARRVFARVPDGHGYPDGLTVDDEDHVWGAHWGGARVTRYRPDGSIERVVPLPVPLTTSCCFGGPGLETLFMTSATIGLGEAERRAAPLSGGVFAVTGLGVRGRPAGLFRG
jgi:D-xylonolactonase